MANLLPEEHKDGIASEYRLRLTSGGLALLMVVLLAGIALLVPSFILTEARHQQHQSTLESVSETDASTSTENNKDIIQEVNNKLGRISDQQKTQTQPTRILQLLAETRSDGVQLNNISFMNEDGQQENNQERITISVSGIADTRNQLLAFEENLQNRAKVSEVDLPIETLASRQNAAFDMTIVVQSL